MGGSGTGTGGVWVVTVMTVGGGVVVVVVRRVTMRRTGRGGGGRCTIRFLTLVCFTSGGLWGWSTICTAPPPITAPPAAHAVSFAKAIRTDIVTSSNRARDGPGKGTGSPSGRPHGRHSDRLCHDSDQEILKLQPHCSKSRSALGFGGSGRAALRTSSIARDGEIRGSGVEIDYNRGLPSILRSPRNFIIERVITMKCRSLAADGGTDYRRSRPSGGGPEDTVPNVAPTGPLGEWYGDGV